MAKRSDHGKPVQPEDRVPGPDDEAQRPSKSPEPATGGDARHDEEQLRENQEQLGVTPDHKTDTMKEKHRGTFP